MRRLLGGIAAAALTAAAGSALSAPAIAPAQGGQLEVGVGVEDASWHVGASAGQYAGDCPALEPPSGVPCTPVSHEDQTYGDADRLDCGPGDDSARLTDQDRARDCERVKRVRAK